MADSFRSLALPASSTNTRPSASHRSKRSFDQSSTSSRTNLSTDDHDMNSNGSTTAPEDDDERSRKRARSDDQHMQRVDSTSTTSSDSFFTAPEISSGSGSSSSVVGAGGSVSGHQEMAMDLDLEHQQSSPVSRIPVSSRALPRQERRLMVSHRVYDEDEEDEDEDEEVTPTPSAIPILPSVQAILNVTEPPDISHLTRPTNNTPLPASAAGVFPTLSQTMRFSTAIDPLRRSPSPSPVIRLGSYFPSGQSDSEDDERLPEAGPSYTQTIPQPPPPPARNAASSSEVDAPLTSLRRLWSGWGPSPSTRPAPPTTTTNTSPVLALDDDLAVLPPMRDNPPVPESPRPLARLRQTIANIGELASEDDRLIEAARTQVIGDDGTTARMAAIREMLSAMDQRVRDTEAVMREAESTLRQTRDALAGLMGAGSGIASSSSSATPPTVGPVSPSPADRLRRLVERARPSDGDEMGSWGFARSLRARRLLQQQQQHHIWESEEDDIDIDSELNALVSAARLPPPAGRRTPYGGSDVQGSMTAADRLQRIARANRPSTWTPSDDAVEPRRLSLAHPPPASPQPTPMFGPLRQSPTGFYSHTAQQLRRLSALSEASTSPQSPGSRSPLGGGSFSNGSNEHPRLPPWRDPRHQHHLHMQHSYEDSAPELSPLTPSYPLPSAPRLLTRNLSVADGLRIRTGYTPTPSRNNSVAPSPGGPQSPMARSVLFGGSASRIDEGAETSQPNAPWRGWTADADSFRRDSIPRPSVVLTRSSSTASSTPNVHEPELLVSHHDMAWFPPSQRSPRNFTTEPETGVRRPPVGATPRVGDSLRRRLRNRRTAMLEDDDDDDDDDVGGMFPSTTMTAQEQIERLYSARPLRLPRHPASPLQNDLPFGMRPTSFAGSSSSTPGTATASPIPPAEETMVQRMNRMLGERRAPSMRLRPMSMAAASSSSSSSSAAGSIRNRPPLTPTADSWTEDLLTRAPLGAEAFARGAVSRDRSGSPSPTRASVHGASADLLTARVRDRMHREERAQAIRSEVRARMTERFMQASAGRAESTIRWEDVLQRRYSSDAVDFDAAINGLLGSFSPATPPGGLLPHEVAALPTASYKDSEEAKKEERCPICLDDYEEEDTVMGVTECGHFFHQTCFSEWLKNKRSCPYCRQGINARRSRRNVGGSGGPPPPPGPSGRPPSMFDF